MVVEVSRKTKETNIQVSLLLYGSGKSDIKTGIGFFDHMLESFAKHSLCDIRLTCEGDTHIDDHHSVEDVGIVLGDAFAKALYPLSGVERFGNAAVVMDEACVRCDLDLANRAYFVYECDLEGKVGTFDVELAEEFFKSFVANARISAHIVQERGKNKHHVIEASFKALGVALRRALTPNERIAIPSTKEVL